MTKTKQKTTDILARKIYWLLPQEDNAFRQKLAKENKTQQEIIRNFILRYIR